MMANHGELDFLVHPNTCGFKCSPQDHLLWSLWGGNKWPVKFQLPSASPAAVAAPAVPKTREGSAPPDVRAIAASASLMPRRDTDVYCGGSASVFAWGFMAGVATLQLLHIAWIAWQVRVRGLPITIRSALRLDALPSRSRTDPLPCAEE